MAKMHSDGRGESGSSKPVDPKNPDWVEYDAEEVEDLVVRLRESEGLDPSQIGLALRDKYGIPSVKQVTDKKVTEILEENDAAPELPEDLANLVDKARNIEEHLQDNPNDQEAERRLELTEDKVRKVADYHREEGNIPEDWEYESEE
ncbi:MAG: 30S ribosomal protein S15 [Candidatus Nanohalobium sp.]